MTSYDFIVVSAGTAGSVIAARLSGLRVADASVMPSIPAANTNATVLAIAERAAAIIGGHDRVLPSR